MKASQDSSTNFTILSLATKESWKNRDSGEWESRTEWHRIAFGKLGEFAASLTKGGHIEVEGTLQSRERCRAERQHTEAAKNAHLPHVTIRADSIRKLDCAERSAGDGADPDCGAAE